MATCFVIQPFDGGPFDKRFEDVFVPAIELAGLSPYRVDRDPAASIPIESIEQGIRNAAICLADITTDNPNVWFELGYAIGCGKEQVLVCSESRLKFPFDVQHRAIVKYATEAPSDFKRLREHVTERLKAGLSKRAELEELAASPLREAKGLKPHEIVCLVVLAENTITTEWVWPYTIREDMGRAGYVPLAVALSLRALLQKEMISECELRDSNGEPSPGYKIGPKGESWLLENQDSLSLRAGPPPSSDDIPF